MTLQIVVPARFARHLCDTGARNQCRVDAKRGDRFLQADFPGTIRGATWPLLLNCRRTSGSLAPLWKGAV